MKTANKTLGRMTRSAISCMFQSGRPWRAPRHRSAVLGVSTRMKIRKQIRLLPIACGVLIVVYLVAFVWRFDILGAPVRDGNHGWLGPPIRGNSQIVDIGKVYYYEGTDGSLYRSFRPVCRVWLWVTGF
jgi:hypothetical protein